MENKFNFEIFEAPVVSEQETEQKRAEKRIKQKKKSKQNLAIKSAGIIAAVILAVIAIMCCYLFSEPTHNPEKLVAKYVNEINNGEWKKAYSRLYFDENSAIYGDEQFINYCKENPEKVGFTSGKIIDFEINKDAEDRYSPKSSRIFYSINYVLEDGGSGTFYLTAEKTNKKQGKFAKYGILPTQNCFSSIKITVPSSTKIRVGSVTFNEPKFENDCYVYYVSSALTQESDIHINNSHCNNEDEFVDFVDLKSGYNELNYDLEITEETYNILCNETEKNLNQLYTDIISGNEDFGAYRLNENYRNNSFKNDIEMIKADVFMGNYTISDFNIEEATPKKSYNDIDKTLSNKNGNEIKIKYNFKYSYNASYNDDKGNTEVINKSDNGFITICYVLINGEWQINGITANAWF